MVAMEARTVIVANVTMVTDTEVGSVVRNAVMVIKGTKVMVISKIKMLPVVIKTSMGAELIMVALG
jgi:hypothetical protein